jgi:hypothetical protein
MRRFSPHLSHIGFILKTTSKRSHQLYLPLHNPLLLSDHKSLPEISTFPSAARTGVYKYINRLKSNSVEVSKDSIKTYLQANSDTMIEKAAGLMTDTIIDICSAVISAVYFSWYTFPFFSPFLHLYIRLFYEKI